MTRRRVALLAAGALGLIAVLGYLRDPPWLVHVTSGLSSPARDESGAEFRWTKRHASFFVPANASVVVLTLRALNDSPRDRPITLMITIDDRPAQVVSFPDDTWRDVRLRLPPPGSRRVRRIDLKLDRLRAHERGLQLRPPQVLSSG